MRGEQEKNQRGMQGKGGGGDLCCVLSASIPSSDPGEGKQRERGEMFLLQCLCLICNRPISLASIPAGQLTNGGTLFKLRRTGGKTRAVSHRLHSPSLKVSDCHTWTASKDIHFSSAPCRCYLFAVIWYFSISKPVGWCVQATWGYHMHYININKRKYSKPKQREVIAFACFFLQCKQYSWW